MNARCPWRVTMFARRIVLSRWIVAKYTAVVVPLASVLFYQSYREILYTYFRKWFICTLTILSLTHCQTVYCWVSEISTMWVISRVEKPTLHNWCLEMLAFIWLNVRSNDEGFSGKILLELHEWPLALQGLSHEFYLFVYWLIYLLYLFLFYIIRMIKSRQVRWSGHAACMERRGMHIGFWWERQKERDH